MEKIHVPSQYTPFPKKYHLQQYFTEYSNYVKPNQNDPSKLDELVINQIEKDMGPLNSAQSAHLLTLCGVANLTSTDEYDFQLSDEAKVEHKNDIPPFAAGLKTMQALKTRREHIEALKKNMDRYTHHCERNEDVNVPSERAEVKRDPVNLCPSRDFLIVVHVFRPLCVSSGFSYGKRFKITQEIVCLSSNTIAQLKDMISCDADDKLGVKVSAESQNIQKLPSAKDMYPSSMIYLGDTLFTDTRVEPDKYVDYTETVRGWGKKVGVTFADPKPMHESTFAELTVRFGYPYMYQHQGNCEHLLTISEARLLNVDDCLDSSKYPIISVIGALKYPSCLFCGRDKTATYTVLNCDTLFTDPAYLCDACYDSYLFVDGKPVGKFDAYLGN